MSQVETAISNFNILLSDLDSANRKTSRYPIKIQPFRNFYPPYWIHHFEFRNFFKFLNSATRKSLRYLFLQKPGWWKKILYAIMDSPFSIWKCSFNFWIQRPQKPYGSYFDNNHTFFWLFIHHIVCAILNFEIFFEFLKTASQKTRR